jgi:hypothetical protein
MQHLTPMEHAPAPVYFDKLNWEQIEHQWHTTQHDEKALHKGQHLHCIHCHARITNSAQCIAVQGSHEHTLTNPHEIVFHIGCFAAAPGCAQVGTATAAWTWFSGYRWQMALCRQCGTHLGWRYQSTTSAMFYGLILNRLVRKDHK